MVVFLWCALAVCVLLCPLRWSLVAFLCLSAIDFEGGRTSFASFNLMKGLVLPACLLWRLRAWSGYRRPLLAPYAFCLLIAYVGIATFWSLFPLAGLKLVGHLLGSFLIAFVFVRGTKAGYLTAKLVLPVTIGTVALGALCTYGYHGMWGDDPSRFTSFMPAQAYAAFLAALYCIALTGKGIDGRLRMALCVLLAWALLLNGSRIWFSGILLGTVLALWTSRAQTHWKLLAGLATAMFTVVLWAAPGSVLNLLSKDAHTNRIASALTAAYSGNMHSTGLGTLAFRREVYKLALHRIETSSISEWLLGRGTCNGAVITGSLFWGYRKYDDPNRMFHNEWLRVVYEWGLLGLLLWLTFMASIFRLAWLGWRHDRQGGHARPLLVYLPAFLIGLWGENILAGAGSAVSVGFIWTVALATISHRRLEADTEAQEFAYRSIRTATPLSDIQSAPAF